MACPYCGTHADWYKLDDGRSRCPGCYATTDAADAERAAKEQEAKDSTDKATTTPPLIADDVAGKATEAPKPASKDARGK